MSESTHRIVMMGATGAVGEHCAQTLAQHPDTATLTLLGRREAKVEGENVAQHVVDVEDADSYREHLFGHDVAVCTVGVGEPSKVDKETFVRVDKTLVQTFAAACQQAGVKHFSLLASVGSNAQSKSFYLRTKGELEDALRALSFERLSLFHPSMILTPTNRYGFTQALALAAWPKLDPVLSGSAKKYRGVKVDTLGRAMAKNIFRPGTGEEVLEWTDFQKLTASPA